MSGIVDLKTLDYGELYAALDAMMGKSSIDRDQWRAESRALIIEIQTRRAVMMIKAELKKLPEDQWKAVLDAAIADEERFSPG